MERRIHSAKLQGLIYKQLASIGIPTSLHCLSLRLADEYSINSQARMPLPPPEHISRISDPSHHHIVLLTDNVLAAFVVVSSTVRSSSQPGKMVFHVITDKKTYAPMHAMFALNAVGSAVVEVKGLQHFDWMIHVSTGLMEMMEFHGLIREHYYYYYHGGGEQGRLEALRPKHFSLLNYMRIYLPEVISFTW